MRRREFVGLLGSTTLLPLTARAQPANAPVVGLLSSRSPDELVSAAFRRGLAEAGFVEGRNVSIAYRWAEGRYERLPALAKELVDLRVSAIAAGGPSGLVAKDATASIPIVFLTSDDPVKVGLTASLNRPGGNVTGVSFLARELGGKRVGLICELVPGASPVALLLNPDGQSSELQKQEVETAAQALGRHLTVLYARAEADFEMGFETFRREQVGALIVQSDPFFDSRREKIVSLAARYAMPAIYHTREFSDAGGLMSYGASLADAYRQVGNYTGRILKGEKAGDLPVMQPTKFELVINLKTAKALGLNVSPSLLARVDEVIE